MTESKWKRRKDARPSEIVSAALEVFAEKGFAAARIEDIAKTAGISKGAVYLYFSTKEDLFRAVVQDAVVPSVANLQADITTANLDIASLLRMILPRLAEIVATTKLAAVAKMVVGESGNFPELARVWYDSVIQRAIGTLSRLIEEGQKQGKIRSGDPRVHAFSVMGPMLMGVLWRETFTPIGADEIDLPALARQHVETILDGLLAGGGRP
jgi:AcrR family transcriptional regulator